MASSDTVYTTEAISSEYIHLNSCGKQSFFGKSACAHRPNGRVDYHILYVTEGVCYVRIANDTVEAREGSMILFLPNEPQMYSYRKGIGTTVYYIHFSGTECPRLLLSFAKDNKIIYNVGVNSKLVDLFEQMKTEYELSLPNGDTACAGYLLTILAIFDRLHSFSNIEIEQPNIKKITDVCHYIQQYYRKSITVADLAEMCYLSESRFSHMFREITQKSPMEYIIDIRIQKAKDLLQNSDLSISEIGTISGMENLYYFSRLFKSRTGLSPSEYRRQSIKWVSI